MMRYGGHRRILTRRPVERLWWGYSSLGNIGVEARVPGRVHQRISAPVVAGIGLAATRRRGDGGNSGAMRIKRGSTTRWSPWASVGG